MEKIEKTEPVLDGKESLPDMKMNYKEVISIRKVLYVPNSFRDEHVQGSIAEFNGVRYFIQKYYPITDTHVHAEVFTVEGIEEKDIVDFTRSVEKVPGLGPIEVKKWARLELAEVQEEPIEDPDKIIEE